MQCTSCSELHHYVGNCSSTRIKDAGITICHSRGRILFYTTGSRKGLERVDSGGRGHKKEVVPKRETCFCYRKNKLRTSNRRKKTSRILWNR